MLKYILFAGWLCSCAYFYILGHNVAMSNVHEQQQHDLCYDTTTHEAWVARKGKELRCFMENRRYPNRVKGSYLEQSD